MSGSRLRTFCLLRRCMLLRRAPVEIFGIAFHRVAELPPFARSRSLPNDMLTLPADGILLRDSVNG